MNNIQQFIDQHLVILLCFYGALWLAYKILDEELKGTSSEWDTRKSQAPKSKLSGNDVEKRKQSDVGQSGLPNRHNLWDLLLNWVKGTENAETLLVQWYAERLEELYARKVRVHQITIERKWQPGVCYVNQTGVDYFNSNGREWGQFRHKPGRSLHQIVREERLPLKLIPNIRDCKIHLRTYDWIFSLFGFDRKHKAMVELWKFSGRNESINRYVVYQFQRMTRLIQSGNPKAAWLVGASLVKNSVAFRVMAYNHVEHNWYSRLSLRQVHEVLRKVARICANPTRIDLRRVYITKANGKLRPLGVPAVEWNVYLHMWQCVITHILQKSKLISDHQHGFLPQRGVLTAWKDIMGRLNHRDIFEFDFKGFFDQVNTFQIMEELEMSGCPEQVQTLLFDLNKSRPVIKEPKLPEPTLERTLHDQNQETIERERRKAYIDSTRTKLQRMYDAHKGIRPLEISETVARRKEQLQRFQEKIERARDELMAIPQKTTRDLQELEAFLAGLVPLIQLRLDYVTAIVESHEVVSQYTSDQVNQVLDEVHKAKQKDWAKFRASRPGWVESEETIQHIPWDLMELDIMCAALEEQRLVHTPDAFYEVIESGQIEDIIQRMPNFASTPTEKAWGLMRDANMFSENSPRHGPDYQRRLELLDKGVKELEDLTDWNSGNPVVWGKPISNPRADLDQKVRETYFNGVAQGAPTSPILSITVLRRYLSRLDHVQYADDGLFFGDGPEFQRKIETEILGDREGFAKSHGIIISPEKSGWVKKDGIWLKPLKFLGMEFDGVKRTFRAMTRNGATLEFTDTQGDLLLLHKAMFAVMSAFTSVNSWTGTNLTSQLLDPGLPGEGGSEVIRKQVELSRTGESWEELFRSEFYGLFFSRMQIDSWNIQMDQDFTLYDAKGSWVGRALIGLSPAFNLLTGTELKIHNASSFACYDLAQQLKIRSRRERITGHVSNRRLRVIGRGPMVRP